jgi:phosphoenolpyruvate synthase/pyruvate phosphate dikinase
VALKYLREKMGFDNVTIMVPFCRSPEEADKVIDVMAEHGLERGKNGLQLYVMTEIPSNVIRAEEFAERFDGFSIGSNDLTQLTLGIDRDSGELSDIFQERDPAVLWMIEQAIAKAHATGSKIGLCGQAPSNDPEFAKLLVKAGIHSISVTPRQLPRRETQRRGGGGRRAETPTFVPCCRSARRSAVISSPWVCPGFSIFTPDRTNSRSQGGISAKL